MGFFYNSEKETVRAGRIVGTVVAGVAALLLLTGSITRVPVGTLA